MLFEWAWYGWFFLGCLFVTGLAGVCAWIARLNNATGKPVETVEFIGGVSGLLLLGTTFLLLFNDSEYYLTRFTDHLLVSVLFLTSAVIAVLLGLRALFVLLAEFKLFKPAVLQKPVTFPGIAGFVVAVCAIVSAFILSVWGTGGGTWSWYVWALLISLLFCGFYAVIEAGARKSIVFKKIYSALRLLQGFFGIGLVVLSVLTLVQDSALIFESLRLYPIKLTLTLYFIACILGILLGIICALDLLRLFRLLRQESYDKVLALLWIPKLIIGSSGILCGFYLITWIFEKWTV